MVSENNIEPDCRENDKKYQLDRFKYIKFLHDSFSPVYRHKTFL